MTTSAIEHAHQVGDHLNGCSSLQR